MSAIPPSAPVWTRLSAGTVADPSLLRAKTGVLHIVFRTGASLKHTTIAADGKPVSPAPIATPVGPVWDATLSAPRLLAGPDGALLVLFAAAGKLHNATSKDAGLTWDAAPATEAAVEAPALFAAVTGKEGKPLLLAATGGRLELPGAPKPEVVYQGACCIDRVAFALDAESQEGWAAWHGRPPGTGTAAGAGLYAKAVKPSAGKEQLAPGSRPDAPPPQLALSPRIAAPGVYLGYRAGVAAAAQIRLWNVRGGEALTIARSPGARGVGLVPAPDGRLWIFWVNAANTVSAVRSDKSLLRFSRPYVVANPAPGILLRSVIAEGSRGPLDVIADGFHTRLAPELQVTTGPDGVRVLDVGDPVEDAAVEIDGKSMKTDAKGLAAYPIAPGSTLQVRVTHPAYADAAVTTTNAPSRRAK